MMGTETVAVLRSKLIPSPYSPDATVMTEDWTDPVRFEVTDVLVEPLESVEPTRDARNQVIVGFRVYDVPAAAGVTARDRVEVRGQVCHVVGDPQEWRLGGWRPGVVVHAEIVKG